MTDLPRTRDAIAAYDREWAKPTKSYAKLEELGEAVGIAFGEDTKEFNNPANCRALVRPGPPIPGPGFELSFVRRMVKRWVEGR